MHPTPISSILMHPDFISSERLSRKISEIMKGKTFHTHFHLLYVLRSLLGEKQQTYLEIGTYFGASLCLMLSFPYPTRITSIDTGFFIDNRSSALKHNVGLFSNSPSKNSLTLVAGNSQSLNTTHYIKRLCPEIDLLYIDGDRSIEGVSHDLKTYGPSVRQGGFIVIDDYLDETYCPGVKQAIDHLDSWVNKLFFKLPLIDNIAGSGITAPYKFKEDKYPTICYNHCLILQKK